MRYDLVGPSKLGTHQSHALILQPLCGHFFGGRVRLVSCFRLNWWVRVNWVPINSLAYSLTVFSVVAAAAAPRPTSNLDCWSARPFPWLYFYRSRSLACTTFVRLHMVRASAPNHRMVHPSNRHLLHPLLFRLHRHRTSQSRGESPVSLAAELLASPQFL